MRPEPIEQPKSPYSTPKVTTFGDIHVITQASKDKGMDDGGVTTNNKTG